MKKKILVFAHETGMNGASHSLLTILIGLKEESNFLVIIPGSGAMEKALIFHNIDYKILDILRCGYFNYVSLKNHIKRILYFNKAKNKYLKELISICNTFKPDILYTNTSVLDIGYDLSKKINKTHIWHIREYGDKDFNISYIPFRKSIISKIKKSKKAIFTTNLLQNHWLGKNFTNSQIVHNGFDKLDGNPKIKTLNKEKIKIGVVGYFIESKGQLESLEILKRLIKEKLKVQLYLYGEYSPNSSYYKEMVKRVSENNLTDKVFFCGYRKQEEIYNNIDFLLNCSNFEAFGRTIIEAMSYGIPVISKNTGGPKEIIIHSKDGFLYNNIEEAATYITQCINNDSEYNTISLNAQEKVKKQFSIERYISNMKEVFENA